MLQHKIRLQLNVNNSDTDKIPKKQIKEQDLLTSENAIFMNVKKPDSFNAVY